MSGTFNPPANPTVGQIYTFGGSSWRWDGTAWVNASTGANFVPLTGGTMTGPLVLSGNAPASAPLQAVPQQQVATAIAAAPDNVGRNLLHNGLLNVQQRGAGPWTTNGYTFDRWVVAAGNDTINVGPYIITDADRAALGDEQAVSAFGNTFTGSATANSYNNFAQRTESTRRLSGKAVTFSFFARQVSGTQRLGCIYTQTFGSGGTPSASVVGTIGATPALTSTFTRYSFTFTIPSAAGKTFGTTAGTDFTQISVYFSDTSNTTGTGIGQQSGAAAVWGLQLEIGSVATPLEKLDPQQDLANCQRFYQGSLVAYSNGYNTAGNGLAFSAYLQTTMRASPTVTVASSSNSNWTQSSITGYPDLILIAGSSAATGGYLVNLSLTASADL